GADALARQRRDPRGTAGRATLDLVAGVEAARAVGPVAHACAGAAIGVARRARAMGRTADRCTGAFLAAHVTSFALTVARAVAAEAVHALTGDALLAAGAGGAVERRIAAHASDAHLTQV